MVARFPVVVQVRSGEAVPDDTDVLVVAPDHPDDLERVARGRGVVVVGAGPWSTATLTLAARRGIEVRPGPERPGALHPDREGVAAVTDQDLLARVVDPEGTAGAELAVGEGAGVLLRAGDGSPVAAVATSGEGAVAVVAADLTGGPAAQALLANLSTWAAPPASADDVPGPHPLATHPAWRAVRRTVAEIQAVQGPDGAVPEPADHPRAAALVDELVAALEALAPELPHDADYLAAVRADLRRWVDAGLGVPDFLDSLQAFQPQRQRVDGLVHAVVFPMYTQNGTRDRRLEAVLVEVIWPDFVAELEAGPYSNRLFVPIRFLDFSAGYDTNSAVLFPETVSVRSTPTFTWGAIFADREAARFRTVIGAAARTTSLALPPDAARLLADQTTAEETFVLWDLIHDRTHMRGDLPFDPFMIKQRMPFFLYALEELRCDLTAFREAVALEAQGVPHARLVQYAVVLDRVFRFAITGTRVRNYDGLGGQLLFAWLHQRRVVHWTDNRLRVEWEAVPDAVLELGRRIEDLYWRSIDRPKISHWLAAYALVAETVTPHPASVWAKGPDALPLTGPLKEMTDAVLPDEFPLSMFFEALSRRIGDVVASTSGITGRGSGPVLDDDAAQPAASAPGP